MKIVITGPKSSGKTTIATQLAKQLGVKCVETDALIEQVYKQNHQTELSCYEICKKHGEPEFRRLEHQAAALAQQMDFCVIATGGSTFMNADLRRMLRDNAIVVVLKADPELMWQRLLSRKSKYLDESFDARARFTRRVELVNEVNQPFGDIVVDVSADRDDICDQIVQQLSLEFAIRVKSPNTLGEIVRLTTFGESHGPAIGAVMDGLWPGIELAEADIQADLDRRRPGQSSVSTSRKEKDRVRILSGVFQGKTTGAPIALVIDSSDHDSSQYEAFKDLFRPGHADFTYWKKFGIRDHRGGGRSSGRETAGRVAGGAVAKKILNQRNVRITAYSSQIAGIKAETFDYSVIENNPVRCPDLAAADKMQQAIIDAQQQGDSVGGIVELVIQSVPPGLGDPVFGKLDARLAQALCSLGAVKGIEFGDGFDAAGQRASQFNDQMADGRFLTNHAGGILGGISTGQDIIIRLAVKPTPSISQPQRTYNLKGQNRPLEINGRHDPCIIPRIVPVVEAMSALVILDAWQIQSRINPDWPDGHSKV